MGWFLHLLQGVPVWVAGLILAALGIAVSQLCIALAARVDHARRRRSNELIVLALSVAAVIYAVPLALIAGEAFGDFTETRAAAAREAEELARAARLATALPTAQAQAVRAGLAGYATAVIAQEWPEMARGGHPSAAEPVLRDLYRRLAEAGPSVPQARMLRQLDELDTARAERVLTVREGLIGAIWWLIGVGGLITLLLCALYAADDLAMQRFVLALISLVITCVILLIVATDRPFHGVPRVPPDAMRAVLALELTPP